MKLGIISGIDLQEAFVSISQMIRGQEVYPTGNLECHTTQLWDSLEGTHLEELNQELDFRQF